MAVLCIGQAVWDTTVLVEGPVRPDAKLRVEDPLECAGGPALNAACLCGMWGASCALMARVGDDARGAKVTEALRTHQVGTAALVREHGRETPWSLIVSSTTEGSRLVLNFPGRPTDADPAAPEGFDVVLSDGHEPRLTRKALEANPRAVCVLDAGSCRPAVLEAAACADWLVGSADFAEQFLGHRVNPSDPGSWDADLARTEALCPGQAVVTLGEKGLLWRKDGQVAHMPAFRAQAQDTCGAGDVFHGAFAYCLDRHMPVEETLRTSSAAASIAVERPGALTSIPSLAEVRKRLDAAPWARPQ